MSGVITNIFTLKFAKQTHKQKSGKHESTTRHNSDLNGWRAKILILYITNTQIIRIRFNTTKDELNYAITNQRT